MTTIQKIIKSGGVAIGLAGAPPPTQHIQRHPARDSLFNEEDFNSSKEITTPRQTHNAKEGGLKELDRLRDAIDYQLTPSLDLLDKEMTIEEMAEDIIAIKKEIREHEQRIAQLKSQIEELSVMHDTDALQERIALARADISYLKVTADAASIVKGENEALEREKEEYITKKLPEIEAQIAQTKAEITFQRDAALFQFQNAINSLLAKFTGPTRPDVFAAAFLEYFRS